MRKFSHKLFYIGLDFAAAALAWIAFFSSRKFILGEEPGTFTTGEFINSLLIATFWGLLYAFLGYYTDIYRKSRIKELLKLITVSFLGVITIFFVLLLGDKGINDYHSYYKTFAAYYLLHYLFSASFKLIELTYIKRLIINKKVLFNTLLVGAQANAKEIYTAVEKNHELLGFTFLGYVHISDIYKRSLNGSLKHFGDYRNIGNVISEQKIEHVVIAVESEEHKVIPEVLQVLENYNVKVSIIPDIYDLLLGSVKVNHVFSVPLVEINQDVIPTWLKTMKRGIDITASLMVLTFGSPFLLTIALLTKFSSRGPVFYSQVRIGKGGAPFRIFKFRSMYTDAESHGPALAQQDDPRVTPWGRIMRRTKLDEFPQFYNVLIGDMSLVGPRPERQFFIDQIVKIAPHYKHLHRVKPGITSLGQVKFGYAENVQEMVKRLKYDIIYIENMSLALDFQIIFYTCLIMFSGRGK